VGRFTGEARRLKKVVCHFGPVGAPEISPILILGTSELEDLPCPVQSPLGKQNGETELSFMYLIFWGKFWSS
jgi:hypothetical protein